MAVEHVAKDFPETYIQKDKAQELRSKIVPVAPPVAPRLIVIKSSDVVLTKIQKAIVIKSSDVVLTKIQKAIVIKSSDVVLSTFPHEIVIEPA